MKPEDRLIINYTSEKAPRSEGLDWHLVTGNVWSWRLPRDTQEKERMNVGEGKVKEGVKK